MRASTRLRVSAPTSAHPLTTLETVITLTLRSRAMSFKRTGVVGALDMMIRAPIRAARCSTSRQKREYTKLRRVPANRAMSGTSPLVRSLARMDLCGGMVKLVYTEALKASSPQGECGFDSHSRYQDPKPLRGSFCANRCMIEVESPTLYSGS